MSTSQLSRFTTMSPTSYDELGLAMGLGYYVIGHARRGIIQPWSSAGVSPPFAPASGTSCLHSHQVACKWARTSFVPPSPKASIVSGAWYDVDFKTSCFLFFFFPSLVSRRYPAMQPRKGCDVWMEA